MLKKLLEDHQKREEEIQIERMKQEEEWWAEWERREGESLAREEEIKEEREAMQAHLDKLVKMVEEANVAYKSRGSGEPSVKLVPLTDKDAL